MRNTRDGVHSSGTGSLFDRVLWPMGNRYRFRAGHGGGFTLVELLIVMAILAILGGLVTAAAQTARKRGSVTKAKAAVAALETALQMYQLDMGGYPSPGNQSLVQALSTNPGSPDWHGPYMEFKEEELVGGEFVDPWGVAYAYVTPGAHRTASYDLFSSGPNGTAGDTDDIVNW